ncbi:MAG: DinB family protein [Alphaproteobacteria bacterium]|nr:DinB family protein [Alphaproteobacteria bacterium]HPF47603.1 DinB family protein [Emcibacteraceae bacterium]HRW29051.1 DinB family protein [Emcibacteraceae bacterium]
MAILPMSEFERFMIMFDRLFEFVETYIHKTPEDKYEWIPVEGPGVSFGDRLENITIKGLYVHLTTSEDGFINSLLEIQDGGEIPIPINKKLTNKVYDGDFIALGRELHENAMEKLRNISPERLSKTVYFQGGEYSVMGFLWALYAHYAYHLGNIDTYMRQGNMNPTAFFNFPTSEMA